ncbi:hypothetical protein E2C01_036433 [Portunus trituberculatus]|uniref:Uncharacterized protein n=1 Tax=Portunus trituberculatus TaxID=210409 RepID=A0A5B7F8Q2_PORTR|nr:hypothetical protein [Portunus trituberculatus]
MSLTLVGGRETATPSMHLYSTLMHFKPFQSTPTHALQFTHFVGGLSFACTLPDHAGLPSRPRRRGKREKKLASEDKRIKGGRHGTSSGPSTWAQRDPGSAPAVCLPCLLRDYIRQQKGSTPVPTLLATPAKVYL